MQMHQSIFCEGNFHLAKFIAWTEIRTFSPTLTTFKEVPADIFSKSSNTWIIIRNEKVSVCLINKVWRYFKDNYCTAVKLLSTWVFVRLQLHKLTSSSLLIVAARTAEGTLLQILNLNIFSCRSNCTLSYLKLFPLMFNLFSLVADVMTAKISSTCLEVRSV